MESILAIILKSLFLKRMKQFTNTINEVIQKEKLIITTDELIA